MVFCAGKKGMANGTKGHLDTYRFCDEVWTFLIKDVVFKMENSSQTVQADKVRIVSCNSKKPGDPQ
jgi:transcription initiation factor TFIIA small subunit